MGWKEQSVGLRGYWANGFEGRKTAFKVEHKAMQDVNSVWSYHTEHVIFLQYIIRLHLQEPTPRTTGLQVVIGCFTESVTVKRKYKRMLQEGGH